MAEPAAGIVTGAAALGEVLVLCTAGVAFCRRANISFAAAVAYALVGTMMTLSLLYQLVFLVGVPSLSYLFEFALVAAAAYYLVGRDHVSTQILPPLRFMATRHPVVISVLTAIWTYLAWRALTAPLGTGQWEALWPVLDLERTGSLFAAASHEPQAAVVLNHRILSHLLLRHHVSFGLGLFGWLAYLSIGLGTYALARRYAWPETAFTAAMLVMSAPRIVFYAPGPGMELIPAAAAVCALLALYRTVEQPNAGDLILLVLCISFAVAAHPAGAAYPMILAALSAIVLFRRHGGQLWWGLIVRHRPLFIAALVPVLIFSQLWLPTNGGGASGYESNADGLVGGLANLTRYGVESMDPTRAGEKLCRWLTGVSPTVVADRLYASVLLPMFGQRGAAAPFAVSWTQGSHTAWFGPLGFCIIFPAWFYALIRGPRRLKAVAVSLGAYLYLMSLIPAWMPGNARLFTAFFAGAGFMTAFFLSPWRLTRFRKIGLQTFCLLLMGYACVHLSAGP